MQSKPSVSTYDELLRLRTHKRHSDRHERIRAEEVIEKVIEDINFLQGRIDHIKRSALAINNPSIIATYESMLQSRESVLAWLQEGTQEFTSQQSHTSHQRKVN